MYQRFRCWWGAAFALLLFLVHAAPVTAQAPAAKVLVFSKTAGYRHDSIPFGIAAVRELGGQNNFLVDATENAAAFTDNNLAQYRAVVFLCTSEDVLNNSQQAAFERYIQSGRGYVGVHSASDTEYDWPWYGGLLGAYFADHPAIQPATIRVTNRAHPSMTALPDSWVRTDEWYSFQTNPRPNVHVLATLDETTYNGGTMGADHPIIWFHTYQGGRAWYTAGGHTSASYSEPLFRQHLLGGILYAAGSKIALYRLDLDGYYFLTADQDEHDALVAGGWATRGPAGFVSLYADAAAGSTPFFRLYNPFNGDHFYTTNADERDAAIGGGYNSEGTAGFVFGEDAMGRTPLFRAYNPATGQHLFTGDANEYNTLPGDWNREGIAAYVQE